MSLRGLYTEFKTQFPVVRLLGIVLLLGLLAIVVVLHFQHKPPAVASIPPDAKASEESSRLLQSLLAVREEASKMKEELSARLKVAHSTSLIRAPQASRIRRETDGRQIFVGFQPGSSFEVIKSEKTEVYIPSGSVFRAQLVMPIKTSLQKSILIARTTNEFSIDQVRRIPQNSRLIGTARLDPTLKGVVAEFHTLVSPNHIEYPVNLLALSSDLFPQLNGIYFSNQAETYGSIMAMGFISGFSAAERETAPSLIGNLPTETATNSILNGVSTASFRVGQDLLEDIRKHSVEYVVVPAGVSIFVVFQKRFTLKDGKPI